MDKDGAEEFSEGLDKLRTFDIWNKWIAGVRPGDTNVGKTFEYSIGKADDNSQAPDISNVECKAKRAGSSALVTYFSSNPETPERSNHQLVHEYGYGLTREGWKRFNTNFAVGRETILKANRHRFTLRVDDDENIHIVANGKVVASWSNAFLIDILEKKLRGLAFLETSSRRNDGIEEFKYHNALFYWGLDHSEFMQAIRDGTISIHFRMKGNLHAGKNRGTAFRLRSQHLSRIYTHSKYIF